MAPTARSGAAASAVPAAPSTGPIEAIVRARIAGLGPAAMVRTGEAARAVVEVLLERELTPALRADPRFADWVDRAIAALDEVPAWREELTRLVAHLNTRAPAGG